MDIGIGLPNTVQDTSGRQLLAWAQAAEEAGFAGLATIGAVEYPGYEELTALAAAAAVTERIGLFTNVLIAPARSAAELAKQAATVDQISQGRLTLGLGVGWRASDFALTGRDFASRGRDFDAMLRDLTAAWAGEPLLDGTRPVTMPPTRQGGVPIVVGGHGDDAVRRVVEHGVGWTAGGMPPDAVAGKVQEVRSAWQAAGRDGRPTISALAYFALGEEAVAAADAYIRSYYAPMGADAVEMIAGSVLATEDAVAGAISAFADAGVDTFYLDPGHGDPEQVRRLAEVALG